MAYKIQYSPETARSYPQIRKKHKFPFGGIFVIVFIFAATIWIRLNGVPEFLIPGDPEVTKAAAVMMITDLREGTRMGEAVTAFCKEILHGAGY